MHTPSSPPQPPHTSPRIGDRVEGPSFPVTLKALATLLVLALVWLAVQGWQGLDPSLRQRLGWSEGLFLLAVVGVVLAGYWGILTSRTSMDDRCIRQTWLWPKEVTLAEITQVKVLQVPGLAWLVVPRLVVRTSGLHLTTFHVADARVLKALRRFTHAAQD